MKIVGNLLFIGLLIACNAQEILKECRSKEQYPNPCGICAPKCIKGVFTEQFYKTCTTGCVCPVGFIMDENDQCIPIEKCKGVPKCPENQEYIACGPSCTAICDGGYINIPKCFPCCKSGCFCKSRYFTNEKGDCVTECTPPKAQ